MQAVVASPLAGRRLFRLVAALVLAPSGCSDSPTLHPVRGRVTVGGEPVRLGTLVFYPTDGAALPGRMIPRAEIGPDGEFRVYTSGREGVPAGTFKVVVSAATHDQPVGRNLQPDRFGLYHLVPARYSSYDESPLRVEVPDSRGAGYDLALSW